MGASLTELAQEELKEEEERRGTFPFYVLICCHLMVNWECHSQYFKQVGGEHSFNLQKITHRFKVQ